VAADGATRNDAAGGLERALEGSTVLDLSQQMPGPYTTMLLRALGARVIKVEPPGGEPGRVIDPPMFALLNGGKESIELDLKTEASRLLLHRLASRCDVLVEGFRPGVAARLGFPFETIAALRPDVVYCSISGYGQAGPYTGLAGHDINYLGVAGGIPVSDGDHADPAPRPIGIPIVDLATGTGAALAIVAALHSRARTGRGHYLDMAMLDTAVFWAAVKGRGPTAGPEPAYTALQAADGRWLTVAVIEDKFWRHLCRALGWADWLEDAALADYPSRQRRSPEILQRLRDTVRTRPRQAWLELFAEADVPAAPVHDREQAARDPQAAARRLFADGSRTVRPPLPLVAPLEAGASEAPPLDGARATILAELDGAAATNGRST
jgi:CoA:oxalate CoA-transferase